MNKPAFQLKPLGAAVRLQTTQKKQVSTIQRNIHKQLYNSLTDTPTEQAILLSQSTSHTGAHLMQPRSEAYEIEDRFFRVSGARRLMLPHPAAANAADVVQFCPNKSAAGVICNKPVDPQQHHCYRCRYGGSVDRRHAAVGRCLADVIQSHSGAKVFIEQEVPALTRVVNGQTEHARMDLVFNRNGSVWVGSQHLSRMLSRFLSSRVFALAQVFSGVHQNFLRHFVAGVRGNACHSSRVVCGNARPVHLL